MNCEDDFCGSHGCTQSRNCPARSAPTDEDMSEEIACTAVMLLAVLTPLFLVAIGVALGWLL